MTPPPDQRAGAVSPPPDQRAGAVSPPPDQRAGAVSPPPNQQAVPETVLSVTDLSVRAASTQLLHEVTFSIQRGERVGLIGESGSGKSLTALSVMGLLAEGLSATGEVRLAGQ